MWGEGVLLALSLGVEVERCEGVKRQFCLCGEGMGNGWWVDEMGCWVFGGGGDSLVCTLVDRACLEASLLLGFLCMEREFSLGREIAENSTCAKLCTIFFFFFFYTLPRALFEVWDDVRVTGRQTVEAGRGKRNGEHTPSNTSSSRLQHSRDTITHLLFQ